MAVQERAKEGAATKRVAREEDAMEQKARKKEAREDLSCWALPA